MLALVIALCLLWIIVAIIGVLVKAVAWLVIVAGVLFIVTIAGGAIHAATSK